MIVTVTLNPAVDEEYIVPNFRPGSWFRASKIVRSPGGKGINISLMLSQLGYESIAMGFLAGFNGEYIREYMRRSRIITNFVHIKGETRTNVYIVDEIGGIETGISEPGPYVDERSIKRFMRNYERMLARAAIVFIGGSIPPGVPQDIYAELIDRAKQRGVPTVIDASGACFRYALEKGPYVAKVDHRFMVELEGVPFDSLDHLLEVLEKVRSYGVGIAIISYRMYGDIFLTPEGAYLAEAERFKRKRSLFGSADALMTGVLVGYIEKMSIEEMIRFAMACALEDTLHLEKGITSREKVEELLDEINIEKIA